MNYFCQAYAHVASETSSAYRRWRLRSGSVFHGNPLSTRAALAAVWTAIRHVCSLAYWRYVQTGRYPYALGVMPIYPRATFPSGPVTLLKDLKERQLRNHFDTFVDRDARYPDYVLDDAAWNAFRKSESRGRKSLTLAESALLEPLRGAKWGYEITIQSLWQEMADTWSKGWGWDAPLRATIADVWGRRRYDKDGNQIKDARSNRVYLRALLKIRRAIKTDGFIAAMMGYTGLSREQKDEYLTKWELTNAPIVVEI